MRPKYAALFLGAALCAGLAASPATAQQYPSRPIQVIVGFAPGSATDIALRLMGEELAKDLGQSVVILNQGGAAGEIGVKQCASANPDGYTICAGNEGTHVISAVLKKNLPYEPLKDFAPITQTYRSTIGIAVNPDMLPVANMAQLIQYAKDKPGAVKFGTSGVGGPQHLAGELLKQRTGADIRHVGYNGAAPAIQDMVAGYLPMVISTLPAMVAQTKTGKVKILAIGNSQRRPDMTDTPLISETVPEFVVEGWSGFFAPAKTDPAIVRRLNAGIVKTLRIPKITQALNDIGVDPVGGSPEELGKLMETNTVMWRRVVETAGIKVE